MSSLSYPTHLCPMPTATTAASKRTALSSSKKKTISSFLQQRVTATSTNTRSSVERMVFRWILLLVSSMSIIPAQNCPLQMWVYDSIEPCNTTQSPNAVGTIYADAQCHSTISEETDTSSSDYLLFPGNYRAMCTPEGKVRFLDSGCATESCSSTSLNTNTNATCDRDSGTIASLYSRLDVPEYIVQSPSQASLGGYYRCLRLKGADSSSVTFVVFGNCSQSDCQGIVDNGVPGPSPTSPTASTSAPTPGQQAVVPTALPTSPGTPEPVSGETPAPSATDATTESPTLVPTSLAPTTLPPVVETAAPITAGEPTMAPIAPTTVPPVSLAPVDASGTPAPITAPTADPPTDNNANNPTTPSSQNEKQERISVAIMLSPLTTVLEDGSSSYVHWETDTKAHVNASAEGANVVVLALEILKTNQTLISGNANEQRHYRRRRTLVSQQRELQTNSLYIAFDLDMRYVLPEGASTPTLRDIFAGAFDSEQERTLYLKKLAIDDPILEPVSIVEVVTINGDGSIDNPLTPNDPSGMDKDSSSQNSNESGGGGFGMIAGIAAGAAVVVLAVVAVLVQRKRKTNSGNKSSMTKTNEVESPSYYGDVPMGGDNHKPMTMDGGASPQRWTNEIVVDPSADDVSTLGGSVLAGLNLVENNNTTTHGEDEPTASVNLDYDYGRSRYRTDGDDRTRSHMTEETGPTTFTNYSKLGMNLESIFADDLSFEQQFEEDVEEYNISRDRKRDEANISNINERVKPFEVRAPPGKLGMVVDTPNGSVPVVRAIKPDSVLTGKVMIGDRLISVDYQDVTNMTAIDVSSLISQKQSQARLLVFCRLTLPPTPQASNVTG